MLMGFRVPVCTHIKTLLASQKTPKMNAQPFYIMLAQLLSHVRLFVIFGLQPVRLLWPWDFPGKNTRVGCHFLLQGIFPNQGLNQCLWCLLHCRWILYLLSHQGSTELNIKHRTKKWEFIYIAFLCRKIRKKTGQNQEKISPYISSFEIKILQINGVSSIPTKGSSGPPPHPLPCLGGGSHL